MSYALRSYRIETSTPSRLIATSPMATGTIAFDRDDLVVAASNPMRALAGVLAQLLLKTGSPAMAAGKLPAATVVRSVAPEDGGAGATMPALESPPPPQPASAMAAVRTSKATYDCFMIFCSDQFQPHARGPARLKKRVRQRRCGLRHTSARRTSVWTSPPIGLLQTEESRTT